MRFSLIFLQLGFAFEVFEALLSGLQSVRTGREKELLNRERERKKERELSVRIKRTFWYLFARRERERENASELGYTQFYVYVYGLPIPNGDNQIIHAYPSNL